MIIHLALLTSWIPREQETLTKNLHFLWQFWLEALDHLPSLLISQGTIHWQELSILASMILQFWFGICSLQTLTQDCKPSAFKTSDSLSAGVFSKSLPSSTNTARKFSRKEVSSSISTWSKLTTLQVDRWQLMDHETMNSRLKKNTIYWIMSTWERRKSSWIGLFNIGERNHFIIQKRSLSWH